MHGVGLFIDAGTVILSLFTYACCIEIVCPEFLYTCTLNIQMYSCIERRRIGEFWFISRVRWRKGDKLGRNSADAICINEATNNGARPMNYVPAIESSKIKVVCCTSFLRIEKTFLFLKWYYN